MREVAVAGGEAADREAGRASASAKDTDPEQATRAAAWRSEWGTP